MVYFQKDKFADMSYMLPHLTNGWQVDQAIQHEEDKVSWGHLRSLTPLDFQGSLLIGQYRVQVVIIRFGHDWDPTCMKMDEILFSVAEKCRNFAVFYLCDISKVPDFNKMYELYDPCTGNCKKLSGEMHVAIL